MRCARRTFGAAGELQGAKPWQRALMMENLRTFAATVNATLASAEAAMQALETTDIAPISSVCAQR